VLHANLFISTPTRNAYPDTQEEVSITNTPEHVVRKHSKSARVQGLLGKSQIAQYADLAFRVKTDKGRLAAAQECTEGKYSSSVICID
jgi:hypothetical protein